MPLKPKRRLAALSLAGAALLPAPAMAAPQVVLLHGLARSAQSMQPMADALSAAGYAVCNIDYPSRHYPIAVLAREQVLPQIRRCFPNTQQPLHFVTHSLGGIVLRQLAADGLAPIGRSVMLGPPNHGSEVVDTLGGWRLFQWLNGPAGSQLGTAKTALPQQLGPAKFQVGVIAGNVSINLLLSQLIPGPDDGKVSLQSAKLEGMADYVVVPVSHPFLMRRSLVISQTLHFLRWGKFLH